MTKYESSIGIYPADNAISFRVASFFSGLPVKIQKIDGLYYDNFERNTLRVNPRRRNVKKINLIATKNTDYHKFWVIANAIRPKEEPLK